MTKILLNNRYQVIQLLGAGGFGETLLAEDTHIPSRRRCVIKQLKPIADDPQTYQMIQQRFEREATTLEYLGDGSDQIPKLYAYFLENGQFYLVQEWIYGQTLRNLVETKGYQSETAVREILLSLLSVLDYVHSKGIIHRDIKPDNIILRSLDNKPVLIDFGAVKETIRSIITSPAYPTRSLVIGTPGYMPSEQAVGRPVYATDIYSLGLTAIYLLTGKSPDELQTNQQTGEILWQNHAPHISPHLSMILNQAIKPQAGDRYSTASKMLYALKSESEISPQSPTTTHTAILRPTAPTNQTQPLSSPSTIPSNNWQKSAWIFGSLIVGGLIGGVAISSMTRQQPTESPIITSSTPTKSFIPESSPPNSEPTDTPVFSQPPPVPVISPPSQQQETTTPEPVFTPSPQQPLKSQSSPNPVTSTPPQPETPAPEPTPQQQNQNSTTSNTSSRSVPAFPTGTAESTVTAALGQPNKISRGLWKTRAFLYNFEPNSVDLGYLFDQKTGVLRQTEVAFAPSIKPEIMQTTLQGMLGGRTSGDINQGLQRVYDRRRSQYSFNIGGLKGIIQRNQEDQIYIGVWDADLH